MNNSLIENIPVRQQVGDWLIQELEQATPSQGEYWIRLLVSRLSRQVVDGMHLAFAWRSSKNATTASESQV